MPPVSAGTVNNVVGFDDKAATVACRQAGMGTIGKKLPCQFGLSSTPIWMKNIVCTGNEERLQHCRFEGFADCSQSGCQHEQDATVACYAPNPKGRWAGGNLLQAEALQPASGLRLALKTSTQVNILLCRSLLSAQVAQWPHQH